MFYVISEISIFILLTTYTMFWLSLNLNKSVRQAWLGHQKSSMVTWMAAAHKPAYS